MASTTSDISKHSAAHVMAAAIKRIYPNVKFGIGPVTKEGFYYDIDIEQEITDQEIQEIETVANEIIKQNLAFQQLILDKESAINFLLQNGQIYKAELVQNIQDTQISFYKLGDEFTDLCRGPHLKSIEQMGIIAISEVNKVHWREDANRPQMQRIHGMLFRSIQDLQTYKEKQNLLQQKDFIKEAEKQDILFSTENSIYFTSKGSHVLSTLVDLIINEYNIKSTVEMLFPLNENNIEYRNLLFQRLKSKNQSYKAFPIHYQYKTASTIKIKKEKWNTTIFTILSAFNEGDSLTSFGVQIESLITIFRKKLGLDISADIICDNLDDTKVSVFSNILKSNIVSHNQILSKTNRVIEMQIYVTDSYDRRWDICTMRVYTNKTPEYVDESNERKNLFITETQVMPIQIIGFYLEDSNFELPTILKPTLVTIIPIKASQLDYSLDLASRLKNAGYFTSVDSRSISMQNKIKFAEESNIPVILVIGNKEVANQAASVRFDGNEVGLLDLESLGSFLKEHIPL